MGDRAATIPLAVVAVVTVCYVGGAFAWDVIKLKIRRHRVQREELSRDFREAFDLAAPRNKRERRESEPQVLERIATAALSTSRFRPASQLDQMRELALRAGYPRERLEKIGTKADRQPTAGLLLGPA